MILILMVAPLALLGIGASMASLGPTALSIGSKISKFYGKYGNTNLGQASQFGLGYGALTNIGYNLSNNYVTSGMRQNSQYTNITRLEINNEMYGRGGYNYRYGNSRYNNRYGKIKVWSRKYRRYIWVRRRY